MEYARRSYFCLIPAVEISRMPSLFGFLTNADDHLLIVLLSFRSREINQGPRIVLWINHSSIIKWEVLVISFL